MVMAREKYNRLGIKQISQQYGLNFLVLFGSQSNGLANETSDYDIGYTSNGNIDISTEHQIVERLKKEFNNPRIDLINLRRTSPLLAKKALFNGKLIFENTNHSLAKEQIRAYHNYVETKPLRGLR